MPLPRLGQTALDMVLHNYIGSPVHKCSRKVHLLLQSELLQMHNRAPTDFTTNVSKDIIIF